MADQRYIDHPLDESPTSTDIVPFWDVTANAPRRTTMADLVGAFLTGGDPTASVTDLNNFTDRLGYGLYLPLAYGATGDGTTDDRAALNTLANTTMSSGGTILINRSYSIQSNMTFPAGVTLRFERNGELVVPTGVTVTINGPLLAGPYPIFDLTGTGTISFGSGSTQIIYPEWWGASPSASAATNSTAIQAALVAGASNCVVQLGRGTYQFDTGLKLRNNNYLRGVGRGLTVLDYTGVASAFTNYDAALSQRLYIVLEHFDLQTSTGAYGIDVQNVKRSTFRQLRLTGFSTAAIRLNGDGGSSPGCWQNWIENIVIYNGELGAPQGTGILLTGTGGQANNNYIVSCLIQFAAIAIHIERGNGNEIGYCNFEDNTVAYQETQYATTPLGNSVHHTRFEDNTTPVNIIDTTGPTGTLLHNNHWVNNSYNISNLKGSIVGPTDYSENGGFESGYNVQWAANGSGVTYTEETTERFAGAKGLKAVGAGSPSSASYYTPLRQPEWFRGQNVTFVAFVRCNAASAVRVTVWDSDGVNAETRSSATHNGDDTWQRMRVHKTIQTDATEIQCRIEFTNSSTFTAYVDHCQIYTGVVF